MVYFFMVASPFSSAALAPDLLRAPISCEQERAEKRASLHRRRRDVLGHRGDAEVEVPDKFRLDAPEYSPRPLALNCSATASRHTFSSSEDTKGEGLSCMKTAPARAGWNNIAQSAGRPINVVVLRQCG